MLTSIGASAAPAAGQTGYNVPASVSESTPENVPDAPLVGIGDPLSSTLLKDLATIAEEEGISIWESMRLYGWHHGFAVLAGQVRDENPGTCSRKGV